MANAETKIHRFPRGLRGIGSGDGNSSRYIAPSVVAIGAPCLRKMEKVKLATAYNLCQRRSSRPSWQLRRPLRSLRGIGGGDGGHYIAPSVVAIGTTWDSAEGSWPPPPPSSRSTGVGVGENGSRANKGAPAREVRSPDRCTAVARANPI